MKKLHLFLQKVDFWVNGVIFSRLNHWLGKLAMRGLKLGMNILEETWRYMKTIWNLEESIFFEKRQTLIVDLLPRKRICLINFWAKLSIQEDLG